MDDMLKSLIYDLDASINEFREKDNDISLLLNLIKNDDVDSLRNMLPENESNDLKSDFTKKNNCESDNLHQELAGNVKARQDGELKHSPRAIESQVDFEDDLFMSHYKKDNVDLIEDTKITYQNMEETAVVFNKDICCDRRVGKITWCSDNSNLMASSYISKKSANNEYCNGMVLVWDVNSCNMNSAAPINMFEFTNTVNSISFVKNSPSIIIGGSSTGRILVWDTRTSRRSPVSFSLPNFSSRCHSEVIALKVVQSEYYSPIFAIMSNCSIYKWKLSMLSAPEEIIYEEKSEKNGGALCADISETPDDIFVFGTYTGDIVKIDPYKGDDAKPEILTNLKFPITSIEFHRSQIESARLPLFLTTSFDCSLRIWNSHKNCQLYVDNKFKNPYIEARWCPSHPAVYATSDSLGQVNFCNAINNSVPFCKYNNHKPKLLCSMAWRKTGTTLAVGKTNGRIILINVDDKLVTPEKEDLSKLNALAERQSYQDYTYSEKFDPDLDSYNKGDAKFDSTNILSSSFNPK